MVSPPGLCFVIAAADRARFVRPGPDDRPHTVRMMDADSLCGFDGGPTEAVGFIELLADRINEDLAVDQFTDLVLVASSAVLSRLGPMITVPRDARLAGSLAAELVTVPDADLAPHLRAWLAPAMRVAPAQANAASIARR